MKLEPIGWSRYRHYDKETNLVYVIDTLSDSDLPEEVIIARAREKVREAILCVKNATRKGR